MPEPITPEQIQPQRLTIGETPVFFTSPLEMNGQQVTQLTIQGERTRGKEGLESAVLLIKEKSRRRGEEGVAFSKPLANVNTMEEVEWEKIEGIQFTGSDGAVHTIPKEQLSLTKPEETPNERPLETIATPPTPTPELVTAPEKPTTAEPKLARSILEKYSGEPTTLTIVGLKAYETRAHDLAAKSMQAKHEAPKDILRALDNIGENIWKHGIGPVYFQEKARQYYMDMLKASNSPFADSSIKIAEAAGKNRYQELLDNKNFLTRGSRRFIEWVKSNVGARTLKQQFALEEIAHMRESGEIKEMEAFEREGASIRKRFEMDFTAQDDVIRKMLGEKLDILDPTKPEHKPLVDDIRGLVRRYATGEIATKADFDKASDELFQTHLKGARPDIFHEAELYSSSLYEVAETMRTKASHEGGLAAIDTQLANMQVRLGMGVMGEATALEPTDVQRGTEMVQSILTGLEKKGIIGPFAFNEVTVSTGVSLALSLAILPKTALSSTARFWGGFAGGAAIGAVFGGVREYRMLEREYLTHLREREAGLTFSPDAKRRAWMERFFVGQRSADDLITAMNSGDAQTKLANLADAKARRALSARQHERNAQRVGLIQFSGRENIETQRTALDLTIAQAEKDLLSGGNTNEQFLADLTAAQTRILSEGASRVEGLSDPLKVTLNILDKYNPEVDIIRRRFPLLGPEAATGAKAQGLKDILKEFRTAARGAAIKKGLQVGLSGALIGLGIREGLQIGSEVLSNISDVPHDLAPPADINPGQNFRFSDNLHMDGTNLVRDTVDGKTEVVAAGFKDYMANTHGALNPDGTLSDNTKAFLAQQAQDHGFKLEIPEADKTEFAFSGNTHSLADLLPGHPPITVPQELHWQFAQDKGWQLMLDAKDGHGNIIQQVLYTTAEKPGQEDVPLDILNHPPLKYIAEQITNKLVPPHDIAQISGLAPFSDAGGINHFVGGTIPDGTNLIYDGVSGGEHVYHLIDRSGNQLLSGIHLDPQGHITNMSALNLSQEAADHGLKLTNPHGDIFNVVEKGGVGGGFDKPVSEMGTEHGASGPWGWLEDPINADKTIEHALPGTNLTKNLFRGFQENYLPTPEHANYTSLNPEDIYHNLPKALFEDTQLVKLGHIMDEAIKMKEVDGTLLENMDPLHRAAYEIGRVGRVATKDEVQLFLDELGGTTKETTVQLYQPIIEQITTETIPASIEGINGSVVTNIITLSERAPVDEFNWVPPIPLVARRPLEGYAPTVIVGEYPVFTEYPAYTEYLQQYPEFKGGYGESLDQIPYQTYVPFYEHALESLQTPPDQRKLLRSIAPQERIKKLYELANIPFNPSATYSEQVSQLSSILKIPVTLEPIYEPRPREVVASRLSAQERYMDRLKSGWSLDSKSPRVLQTLSRINGATKGYYEELEKLNKQLPPMHPECKMSVVIPVFNEEIKIERSLTGWLEQYQAKNDEPMHPDAFEIILFVNRPNAGTPYDGTIDKIDAIRKNPKYANFHIHVVEKTFTISDSDRKETINGLPVTIPKGRRMGLIYGLTTDMAILRNLKRNAPDEVKANYVLKTGGADAYARSPYYIDETLNVFDRDIIVEQYNARSDYPARVYDHVPLFYVTERFRDLMNELYTEGKSNLGLGVYRASLYSEAGGFNPVDDIAEEVRMNERMRKALLRRAAAQGKERSDVIRRDELVRAIDDPRRALSAVWTGKPMLHDYTNFWNNEVAKSMDVETLLNTPVPPEALLTPENLKRQIEPYIQYYARLLYQNHPVARGNMSKSIQFAQQFTQTALAALGFQPNEFTWTINADIASKTTVSNPKDAAKAMQISFSNLENLQAQIEEFKKKEKPAWVQ